MKRIITAALLIVVTVAASVLITGCNMFGGGAAASHSEGAKNYLKTKYGEDFIEISSPRLTPGSNKYEYYFSDDKAPSVFFNVYETNGHFTDNYERKQSSFSFVDSPLKSELEMYGINSMIDTTLYDDKSEGFSYLVVEEPALNDNSRSKLLDAKTCIKEFSKNSRISMTVALFSLNAQDFNSLLTEFRKTHTLNNTIVEQYRSCVHYSFVVDSYGNVLRDAMA